jgi:hypothetical protein
MMLDDGKGMARITCSSVPCGVATKAAGVDGASVALVQPTAANDATTISPHNRFIRALLGVELKEIEDFLGEK